MAQPFDSAGKFLVVNQPLSWTRWLGYTSDNVRVCNVDLSSISSSTDALLSIDEKEVLHIEFDVNYKIWTGDKTLFNNVAAKRHLKLPVRSVVILLRPAADGPAISGVVRDCLVDGTPYLEFHYEVIRVWELSPEKLFECGLGVLPLAFAANVKKDELPALVKRTKKHLAKEKPSPIIAEVWVAIGNLLGLRFDPVFIKVLLKGISAMKESSFYQMIIEEGEANEARKIVLRQGTSRFGKPDNKTLNALNRIDSKERLEHLTDRVLVAANWKELLKS